MYLESTLKNLFSPQRYNGSKFTKSNVLFNNTPCSSMFSMPLWFPLILGYWMGLKNWGFGYVQMEES